MPTAQGGAIACFECSGDVGAELDDLFGTPVLWAINEGEGAVRTGAVRAGGGIVGEGFALGGTELIACGADF
jgi:hypothetical protein